MKRYPKLGPVGCAFVAQVREVEERLFPELLDPDHPHRLSSARRSWEYRPSHHVRRGLVGVADLEVLAGAGRRVLSVGAHPCCLERLLCELGVPPEKVVVADRDPDVAACAPGAWAVFDLLERWPELGRFDLVLFPESLCIALSDRVAAQGPHGGSGAFPGDALEARLLAHMVGEALVRLAPGGEIRADGPMSHPNVVRTASEALDAAGLQHVLEYDRFFLRVRVSQGLSERRFA